MLNFLLRRLLSSVMLLFVLASLIFLLVHTSGDPIAILLSGTGSSEAYYEALRAKYGYDQPLFTQYVRFLGNLARGDFGESFFYRVPALPLVLRRAPATIQLASFSMFVSLLVALPIGVLSGVNAGKAVDQLGMAAALFGQSIPYFWLGIMGVLLFSVHLGWLPAGGSGTFLHILLPGLSLATFPVARLVRVTRSSVLDVAHQDYVNVARAKGLRESRVLFGHIIKNASLPIATVAGLLFGEMLGGSVIIETVFSWPGLGRLAVQSVMVRDVHVLQVIVFVIAAGYLACNTAVDVAYTILDPRVIYE